MYLRESSKVGAPLAVADAGGGRHRLRPGIGPADGARVPAPRRPPSRRPSLAGGLAVVYVTSVPFDGLPLGDRSVPFVVSLVFVVAALADLLRPGRPPAGGTPLGLAAVAALMVWAVASYFWAFDPDVYLLRLPTAALVAIVTVLLPAFLGPVWRAAVWGYCASSTILAVAVLLAPADMYAQRRTASGNANDVAAFLAMAVVMALHLALTSRARSTWWGFAFAVPCAVGLVATGSRTGAVAVVAGTVLVLVHALWKHRAVAVARMPLVVGAGLLIALGLSTQYVPPRLTSLFDSVETGELSGREYIWSAVLSDGLRLRGVGLGNSQSYLEGVHGMHAVTHNVALGLILELGLVGLALFAVVVLVAVAQARRSIFRPMLLPLGLVICVMSTTLSLEWRRSLWLVVAFALTTYPSLQRAGERR
ncbi:O-antigen ligase family protein [Micromonospora sp. DR5-3]|uniref:O-antigen ligase family protein n=1 Tax=unclassified Micromonospora TaxID=2617518 RepID=UPI002106DE33|nr:MULTISPECIES: O-antigen ligase family protein [unclassified Micromonospora]MCW3814983.1 O-antigen ligase family protein [Micromonospora sp. DR5-3]